MAKRKGSGRPTCGTCRWWRLLVAADNPKFGTADGVSGRCCRHAPPPALLNSSLLPIEGHGWLRPVTGQEDFCGDHVDIIGEQ